MSYTLLPIFPLLLPKAHATARKQEKAERRRLKAAATTRLASVLEQSPPALKHRAHVQKQMQVQTQRRPPVLSTDVLQADRQQEKVERLQQRRQQLAETTANVSASAAPQPAPPATADYGLDRQVEKERRAEKQDRQRRRMAARAAHTAAAAAAALSAMPPPTPADAVDHARERELEKNMRIARRNQKLADAAES